MLLQRPSALALSLLLAGLAAPATYADAVCVGGLRSYQLQIEHNN